MSTGRRERWLGSMLVALGAGIAAAAILGPLILDILVYRTSGTTLHQIVGGDLRPNPPLPEPPAVGT
jgi:hypothetical protein